MSSVRASFGYAALPSARAQARITIEAPVEDVWNVISDVTRVGEWSWECCQLQLAPAL